MNDRKKLLVVTIGFIGSMWAGAAKAEPRLTCPANAEAEVVATMVKMFAAASIDDLSSVKSITTEDSYAFDGGRRFTFDSLMELIHQAHKAGTVFEWRVTVPETHVQCDHAWITYLNQGSLQKDGVRTPVEWLESAQLQYISDRWQIQFFHSTRVVGK